jgi:hypothetical protein
MKMLLLITVWLAHAVSLCAVTYPIVDTGQTQCYDNTRAITAPRPGQPFYGQDAQHAGCQPAYRDNGDGTISDLHTGLTWMQARGEKVTFAEAMAGASRCRVGGHRDWRMPTIKELYSLINFTGSMRMSVGGSVPYLDTRYFAFAYGNPARGEREIDCQDWSATQYLGTTMNGSATIFGVNFADGRIKGYPRDRGPRGPHQLYVRYVRGNAKYGQNDFVDHRNGTITDRATGLIWAKEDSGVGMDWASALAWVQARNAERYLGYSDWRLPNAKELQSIVDYSRSPTATGSAAIDPVFHVTRLQSGEYPYYWTSTTHMDGPPERQAAQAVYVCFGRALGWMALPPTHRLSLIDVHGAGAQRSDPKSGDPARYPRGRGPQGDDIRIDNFVRPVRGG